MNPNKITIHCSATQPKSNVNAEVINKMHVARGFRMIGYHYVIRRDGSTEKGRPNNTIGAHVRGHNSNNLGICLSGGVDENNKPEQNYTDAQYHALYALIVDLCKQYAIPFNNVRGHRDWFPDHNGDGIIDSRDWLKACPCFDVKGWLKEQLILNEVKVGKL